MCLQIPSLACCPPGLTGVGVVWRAGAAYEHVRECWSLILQSAQRSWSRQRSACCPSAVSDWSTKLLLFVFVLAIICNSFNKYVLALLESRRACKGQEVGRWSARFQTSPHFIIFKWERTMTTNTSLLVCSDWLLIFFYILIYYLNCLTKVKLIIKIVGNIRLFLYFMV